MSDRPLSSPFHPSHYPPPWPFVPFANPCPPVLLQERILAHLLPKTLYVHGPYSLLHTLVGVPRTIRRHGPTCVLWSTSINSVWSELSYEVALPTKPSAVCADPPGRSPFVPLSGGNTWRRQSFHGMCHTCVHEQPMIQVHLLKWSERWPYEMMEQAGCNVSPATEKPGGIKYEMPVPPDTNKEFDLGTYHLAQTAVRLQTRAFVFIFVYV
ncbi:hypothetical protein EDD15DRAFT_708995 [Pisolithus albus]|nr:hypothetical protein EDD15DRAFT_708995 [Pisolithus albus]